MKKRSDATGETAHKPRATTRSRTSKSTAKTPLILVLRRPGVSIDVKIDRPKSLSMAFRSFFPQMAQILQSGHFAPSNIAEASHRKGGLAGTSLVDFVIDDIGKLAPSDEDLARLRTAIDHELTRRQEAS